MEDRDPSADAAAQPPPGSSPIILRFERFSSFVDQYASHLSLSGIFLATPALRPVGEIVDFVIELTDDFRLVQGVGEVVWLRGRDGGPERPAGIALRFRALDEKGRELILKILEEQVRSGGAPFELEDVPEDALSAPGALPEAPVEPADPDASVAGVEARLSRQLAFDAPWGKELPAVPEEVLDDTGSLSEPPPAPAAKATAAAVGEVDAMPAALQTPPAAEAESREPPAAEPPVEAFRLAAEAARELESLPELAPPAAAELDELAEPDLNPDADDFAAEPPGELPAAVGEGAPPIPGAGVELAEPVAKASDAAAGGGAETAAGEVESGAASAARAAPVTAVAAAAAAVRPSPASVHGPVLDYEHELATGDGRRSPVRGGGRSSLRLGLAGVVLVAAAAAGGWWLWGHSPAPPSAALPTAAPPVGVREAPAPPPPASAEASESSSQPLAAIAGEPSPPTPDPAAAAEARQAPAAPAAPPAVPASAVRDVSWRSDAGGTLISITLDGDADPDRVRHDRLEWSADREQISLLGIESAYLPAAIAVGSPELVRIRTGLHDPGGSSELRLVFDLTPSSSGLEEPRFSGERLLILVRRGPS